MPGRMARTALFSRLRRLLAAAHVVHRTGVTPGEALAASRRGPSRRDVLAGALGAAALVPLAAACGDDAGAGDAVAVIGGGTAGLHCAYRLAEAGVPVVVYEASARVGGRMHTARDLFADGQICELGGELIDSGHVTMQALAAELGLTLDDLVEDTAGLRADTFHFDGQVIADETIVAEFTPLAALMASTVAAAEADDAELERVDAMSIPAWLEAEAGLPPTSLIRRILEVAYTIEYGLEADEQSILNLLYLIDAETPDPFRIFGDSDERYHLREGSDAIPTGLAAALGDARIRLEHALASVAVGDDGRYRLGFANGVEVVATHVVLAIPFTKLRQVDLSASGLSSEKRTMIDELGYGTNAKLMLGFASRPWRELGASGSSFSDVGQLQSTWETSRGQAGGSGILTDFVGGARGVAIGEGDAEDRAAEVLPWLDAVFPGTAAAYVEGSAVRMHWPTQPYALGSYACYRPGQWAFWSREGEREGNLHFCGEHTSLDFQGYMEGAAETGALVAVEILDDLGVAPSARLAAITSARRARRSSRSRRGRPLPSRRASAGAG